MRSAPYAEELWPVPDPWETARAFAGRKHLLFLDSSDRQTELGRYSYISFDPIAWFENPRVEFGQADPFAGLTKRYSSRTSATIPDLPPFQGGFAGLFGYGLIHGLERIPRPQFDEFQVPDLAVGLYDWVLAFDHHQNRAWIIAQSEPRLWGIKRILSNAQPPVPAYVSGSHVVPATSFPLPGHPDVVSNFSKDAYLEVVRRAVEYVHAGDCFQVNLSQRLLAPLKESPLDLYGRLRERNPAPFGGYFDLGNFVVASTSPERFLKVERHMVETRPIKGTRPRGADENEDRTIIAELSASRKDRAENIMIVDLLRNDLGRVCEYGSIQVPQVCDVESFRFVHHLVSVVAG